MKCIVTDTISFLSNTFPKIYSSLYLNYLKQYSGLYDVNKTQLRALVFMRNYGEISMTELCAKLNIEKGSLTSMIDDLSKKGYVYREKNLKDRRKYMIVITEEGKQIAADFIPACTWCELHADSPFKIHRMLAIKTIDGRKSIDGNTFRIIKGQ